MSGKGSIADQCLQRVLGWMRNTLDAGTIETGSTRADAEERLRLLAATVVLYFQDDAPENVADARRLAEAVYDAVLADQTVVPQVLAKMMEGSDDRAQCLHCLHGSPEVKTSSPGQRMLQCCKCGVKMRVLVTADERRYPHGPHARPGWAPIIGEVP